MEEQAKIKAPGRADRQGITLIELLRMFPTDKAVDRWLVKRRWPNRIACVSCGSVNVQTGAKHRTMPYRCCEKECGKKFSVRTGTVMESSKMGHQTWVFAIYITMTSLKGVSSMKLHPRFGHRPEGRLVPAPSPARGDDRRGLPVLRAC